MSLSVARQLLGRVLNDRQGDAEKNTPETEWRRQRDLQVRLGVIGKALVAVIDELELHQSSTEESEEIEEELRKLLLTIDPTGSITNYNSGPGSGNPGSPGSPGGGARVTLSLVRLLGNVFVRSKDDEGVLELLRGALHHVGSRLDGLGRDIQVVAASGGGGGGSVDNPMTSDLDAGGYKITNYGTPSAAGDVTDKAYVDGEITTLDAALTADIAAGDALAIPKSLVDAKGDLLTATADNTPARLAVGADDEIVVADSTQSTGLRYRTFGAAMAALLTTTGDIAYRNASSSVVRLPLGTNGQVLTVDTGLPGKIKWATPSGGAGSLTLTEVEVNLSSTPAYSGSFTFTIASSTVGLPILITQSYGPYTDKGTLADEAEMDIVNVVAEVTAATTATAHWTSWSPVKGVFKFNYAVSA